MKIHQTKTLIVKANNRETYIICRICRKQYRSLHHTNKCSNCSKFIIRPISGSLLELCKKTKEFVDNNRTTSQKEHIPQSTASEKDRQPSESSKRLSLTTYYRRYPLRRNRVPPLQPAPPLNTPPRSPEIPPPPRRK